MSRESLKTAISRWENGHVQPDSHYRGILRSIFGLTDEELGFVNAKVIARIEPAAPEPLTIRIARARAVDGEAILMLGQQTDTLRRLDRRVGAPVLLAQMTAHVSLLDDLTSHATKTTTRRQLAAALADASALSAWQALDVGAVERAWSNFERAKAAAREANDLALFTHAEAEQAYILLDLEQFEDAAGAASNARERAAGRVAPRVEAWLDAANAEMAAAAGEGRLARQCLDAATDVLPAGSNDSDLPYICLDKHHLGRWAGNVLARLGDPSSLDVLTSALDGLDPEFNRARGSLHIDIATVYAAIGERDMARVHSGEARSCISEVGSVRQRRRLLALAA
jgi:hypothetical protein